MPKGFASYVVLAALIAAAPLLSAQASPAASGGGSGLQLGVGATYLNPDYNSGNNYGLTVYTGYDFFRYAGVEADLHFGGIVSPHDIAENTYLAGPRGVYHFRKAAVYGKALFGRATIKNTDTNQSSAFFAIAYGGGLEYRVKPHYNIRVIDFEQQKWPGFKPHALSPLTLTIGVAYVFR